MSDEERTPRRGGMLSVEAALAFGGRFYEEHEDFNAAIDHVFQLLTDAVILLESSSFGSAAFMAITALEETSKAHVGTFRRDKEGPPAKGRDPFRDHRSKHSMALLPTVLMSERIMEALGADRAKALDDQAHETGFVSQREAALYCALTASGFVTPATAITPLQAWELLILAIEAADDALVGFNNHSFEVGKKIDAMFERVRTQRPSTEPA